MNDFQVLAKENQVVAGAVSLWGLSVITYLVRNVPTRIYAFVKEQITTDFTFNNAGNDGNQDRFNNLLVFIFNQGGFGFSRKLLLRSTTSWYVSNLESGKEITPGYGLHFFIWKKRLYWYTRGTLASTGTAREKEFITISTFGRSHLPFHALVTEALPKEKENTLQRLQYDSRDGWERSGYLTKRPLSTVVAPNGLKEKIVKDIEEFLASEQWYIDRGLSYKEVYVLHGPPGTGKTSLISAIASHFNMKVAELDITIMTNATFRSAISGLEKGTICLIEDFDSAKATHARKGIEGPAVGKKDQESENDKGDVSKMFDLELLTLSGILNTLNGIGNLHGVIIFMTTNCIDVIDQAILRKARTDQVYELGYCTDKEIREYANIAFPGIVIPEGLVFEDDAGCNIYAAFKENKRDPEAFLATLKKKSAPKIQIENFIDQSLKKIEGVYKSVKETA